MTLDSNAMLVKVSNLSPPRASRRQTPGQKRNITMIQSLIVDSDKRRGWSKKQNDYEYDYEDDVSFPYISSDSMA